MQREDTPLEAVELNQHSTCYQDSDRCDLNHRNRQGHPVPFASGLVFCTLENFKLKVTSARQARLKHFFTCIVWFPRNKRTSIPFGLILKEKSIEQPIVAQKSFLDTESIRLYRSRLHFSCSINSFSKWKQRILQQQSV